MVGGAQDRCATVALQLPLPEMLRFQCCCRRCRCCCCRSLCCCQTGASAPACEFVLITASPPCCTAAGPLTPLAAAGVALRVLQALAEQQPAVDAHGEVLHPLPAAHRQMASPACLPHIAQVGLVGTQLYPAWGATTEWVCLQNCAAVHMA